MSFQLFFLTIALLFINIAFGKNDANLDLVKKQMTQPLSAYSFVRKEWKHLPKSEIILAYKKIDSPKSGKDFGAKLFLVGDSDQLGPKIIALGELTPEIEYEDTWDYSGTEFMLDLAPYRLSQKQMAIGVRFKYLLEFPAGQNSSEFLYLFLQNDQSLNKVFEARVSEEDTQRGPNDSSVMTATVAVTPATGGEMNDLILKEKWVLGSLIPPDEGQDEKEMKCTGKKRYTFVSSHYMTQNKSCTTSLSKKYSEKMKKIYQKKKNEK